MALFKLGPKMLQAKKLQKSSSMQGYGKAKKLNRTTISGRKRNMKLHVKRGNMTKTAGGLKEDAIDVVKTKTGTKYVSSARRKLGMKHPWILAVQKARKQLGDDRLRKLSPNGTLFVPIKKGTELYTTAKSIYSQM